MFLRISFKRFRVSLFSKYPLLSVSNLLKIFITMSSIGSKYFLGEEDFNGEFLLYVNGLYYLYWFCYLCGLCYLSLVLMKLRTNTAISLLDISPSPFLSYWSKNLLNCSIVGGGLRSWASTSFTNLKVSLLSRYPLLSISYLCQILSMILLT